MVVFGRDEDAGVELGVDAFAGKVVCPPGDGLGLATRPRAANDDRDLDDGSSLLYPATVGVAPCRESSLSAGWRQGRRNFQYQVTHAWGTRVLERNDTIRTNLYSQTASTGTLVHQTALKIAERIRDAKLKQANGTRLSRHAASIVAMTLSGAQSPLTAAEPRCGTDE